MGGVVGSKEIDSEVIYIDGESDRQGCVDPKTRGVHHSSLAMGLEVADKTLLGDDAGFLEYVHPFSNFDLDIAARVGNSEEGVLNNHLVWDVF